MKKYIFAILLSAVQFTAVAQTVNVHFKNGQTIEFPSANVDFVDFSAKPSDPTLTAGQVVDLGLSVYWASCNLGAEKPEEYGKLYAWGETKTKTSSYSFYDSKSTNCIYIGDNISGTEYDAARVLLGEDWRLPTKEEFEELLNNCTWEWTQINDINGYRVIGNNGNSIFVPAAGFYPWWGVYIGKGEWLGYWSGTASGTNKAHILLKQDGNCSVWTGDRQDGYSIRPVTTNINAGGDPIDHSQDYLVTEKVSASFLGGSIMKINDVIQGSSVLNVMIKNGSSEKITLVGVQMNDAANGYTGNNALGEEVEIPAGESKSYGITLGRNMTTPVVCFTYRYNNKNYTAEATWNN